jgi:hypothetical protein
MNNLILLLIAAAVVYLVWRHARRQRLPHVLPGHVLYTVTCPPEIRDATDRAQRVLHDLHHQIEPPAPALLVTQLAWREVDDEKPRGLFVYGIPADIAERGLAALRQNFRGCIIKPVRDVKEFALYRAVFEGWRLEDEQRAAEEAERARLEAERAAKSAADRGGGR